MLIIYVLVEGVDDAYDYIVGQLADFTFVEDDDSISDDYYISSEQQIMIMLNKTEDGVAIAIYSAEKFE